MKLVRTLVVVLVLSVLGVAAFVYSGVFDVAADIPHSQIVYRLLEETRQHAIAARASGIVVPPLDDPKRIADGGEHYAAMCKGCHLAPGIPKSELRDGLYPKPPDFTRPNELDPAQMFWAIKHGVKLTAMPAWGKSHDDNAIWALVAFVKKLPTMTPEQYRQASGAGDADEHHHSHDEGNPHEHEHENPPSPRSG